MKKFVRFFAKGVIYNRDDKGKVVGVKEVRKGDGITRECTDLPGKVFMQCPNLLSCDYVALKTEYL